MKKSLYLIPLIFLGVAVVIIFGKFPPSFLARYFKGLHTPPLSIGMAAPQFELESIEGEKLSLSQLIGKPVLIKFWSMY